LWDIGQKSKPYDKDWGDHRTVVGTSVSPMA
jgi:hypothetical protein